MGNVNVYWSQFSLDPVYKQSVLATQKMKLHHQSIQEIFILNNTFQFLGVE